MTRSCPTLPPIKEAFMSHPSKLFDLPIPWFLQSRRHLLGTLLLILALPMGIFLFLIQAQIARRLEEQAMNQNMIAARVVAQAVQEHVSGITDYLESLSRQPELVDLAGKKDIDNTRRQLREAVKKNPRIDRIFVTDPRGTLWSDYPRDPEVYGTNFSFQDWYQGILRAKSTYVSEIYKRSKDPQPYIISIATPIRSEDQQIVGYIVAQYRPEPLLAWLHQLKPSGAGTIRLIDHHGQLVIGPMSDTQTLINLGHDPLIQKALANKIGSFRGEDPVTGVASLIGYKSVESIGWVVLSSQPVSLIFDTLTNIRNIIFGLSTLCVLVMLFLGFIWLNAIRRYHKILFRLQEVRGRHLHSLMQAMAKRRRAEEMLRGANEELSHKMEELKRMNRIMMDREKRVLELKERVKELAGKSPGGN